MIFSQQIIGNSRTGRDQWQEVIASRMAARNHNMALNQMAGLNVNTGLIPQDVYQDFDNVTVERMRSDDGDTFLNDLLPLSSSVNIGKLIQRFRQASDAGLAQSSMSGQIGVKMDQVEYAYDGSIVPVHDAGYFRNWRECNAMNSEGFDALIDDQRETVGTLRRHLANNFMDGHKDNDGNLISVESLTWGGIRNDTRVEQIDLGVGGVNFDFTDTTKTFEEIEAAFKQVRDIMWITNECEMDLTYYVSREIASNFERNSSEFASSENKVLQRLASLMGVAAIKTTSKLTGNQMMGFPLDRNKIRPVVGMGMNTVAMPRQYYNSNYEFVVWGAIGFQVRQDYFGKTCVFYASA